LNIRRFETLSMIACFFEVELREVKAPVHLSSRIQNKWTELAGQFPCCVIEHKFTARFPQTFISFDAGIIANFHKLTVRGPAMAAPLCVRWRRIKNRQKKSK